MDINNGKEEILQNQEGVTDEIVNEPPGNCQTDGKGTAKDNMECCSKDKDEEIIELQNKLVRLQADFDNYRKRAQKERADTIKYANEELICSLLPVQDNFERAIQSLGDEHKNIVMGIQMIYRQLGEILTNIGLQEVKAFGEEFDPTMHESVVKEASDKPENTIIEVLRKGYIYSGKVLRPSLVKVSSGNN